jgi:peptidoglycan hydrolase CwlO-like protein
MKKIITTLAALALIVSISSCRETTGEKAEDAIKAAVEDTENNIEKAGDAIEEAVEDAGDAIENAGDEIEEEIDGTDDVNGDDDN